MYNETPKLSPALETVNQVNNFNTNEKDSLLGYRHPITLSFLLASHLPLEEWLVITGEQNLSNKPLKMSSAPLMAYVPYKSIKYSCVFNFVAFMYSVVLSFHKHFLRAHPRSRF